MYLYLTGRDYLLLLDGGQFLKSLCFCITTLIAPTALLPVANTFNMSHFFPILFIKTVYKIAPWQNTLFCTLIYAKSWMKSQICYYLIMSKPKWFSEQNLNSSLVLLLLCKWNLVLNCDSTIADRSFVPGNRGKRNSCKFFRPRLSTWRHYGGGGRATRRTPAWHLHRPIMRITCGWSSSICIAS